MSKTRVLVVDDSALMRQLITEILSSAPDIEVVGSASDPYRARDAILQLKPDVMTLDVEMPRMDGITFLQKLMSGHPMPVVMVSSLTEKGCDTTIRALELGAVDFVTKPKIDVTNGMGELGTDIIDKVRAAARAKVRRRAPSEELPTAAAATTSGEAMLAGATHKVIAIGASTGGTEALLRVLSAMPSDAPGIVAVIHMPPGFTASYSRRLNDLCALHVSEAVDGDPILPGHALIAPGNFHMEVRRSGARYFTVVREGQRVCQHRPSVDVLFNSCARTLGSNGVGVILTGMGNDGAEGLLAMRNAGAATFGQNEATCVVYGMPAAADEAGAVETILPLDDIAPAVLSKVRTMDPVRCG
ncbi:MAG: chemotaxis response regulator protein-glutamate methylesterase [Planctomycetaceae bacterium]|nr:chemotaxis response regulator protein-glutamate methylesterase [Planctomycetaceae bacterium]